MISATLIYVRVPRVFKIAIEEALRGKAYRDVWQRLVNQTLVHFRQ